MSDGPLEKVLRRDRLVVAAALGVIATFAWGYVLWLADDMDMGGMDMTGFRMIPAGIGIMAPANAPWRVIEFAFVFAMWSVMMAHDGAFGRTNDPYVRPGGSAGDVCGQALRRDWLVRRWLFPGLDRLCCRSDLRPIVVRTGGVA